MTVVEERRERLAQYVPALMVVTDQTSLRGRPLAKVVAEAVDGGANMVQLREKSRDGSRLVDFVVASVDIRRATEGRCLLFASGGSASQRAYTEAARVLRADGLHLAEVARAGSPPRSPKRRDRLYADESLIISRSVHSLEAALQAERDGADMLVLGTVFPSASHPGGPTIGVAGVRAVCDAVRIPVIGIGGITAQNAAEVMRAGASGIAVISAIFDAADPRAAAARLRAAIDAAWKER